MASVVMLIGGALANALAICSIDYLKTASIKKERDMMQQ